MKHLSDEQLVRYHYREGDDSLAVEGHLEVCESCRATYRRLQQVLAVVSAVPVPECGADYPARVWQRLRPRLKERPQFRGQALLGSLRLAFMPRWAWASVLVLGVVAAFCLGALWAARLPSRAVEQTRGSVAAELRRELRQELLADFQTTLNQYQERSSNALAALEARLTKDSKGEAQQLVQALTEVLNRARAEDRQVLLGLFGDWEERNAAAYTAWRRELEAFASETDQEMRQARMQLVQLAAAVRPPTEDLEPKQ